ncbi:uncharacterized protein N7469_004074 [Penicillium citrinum]|uniref:Zn(2)-C6 fungal-type domain-containing protein n=1 Tax=Penicillium citrinum TaxID=5077 RepID=A0A9W9TQ72_PENCI|nr:uncharacterized protein N7469_004074 [Penicillium citrinum]KAJ5234906.1 hypothetical protein N7469_004074 [Penicillium citrinum]
MEDSIMSDLISSTNVDSAVAIKPEIFQQRRQPKQNRRGSYDPEPDYSAIMRRRFQEHDGGRRTARACDRCKCRKLPCDSNGHGCNNCAKADKPCNVTDQITGETNPRDIITKMRKELSSLKRQVQDKDNEIYEMKQCIQDQAHQIQILRHGPPSDCLDPGSCYNTRAMIECLSPGSITDIPGLSFDPSPGPETPPWALGDDPMCGWNE